MSVLKKSEILRALEYLPAEDLAEIVACGRAEVRRRFSNYLHSRLGTSVSVSKGDPVIIERPANLREDLYPDAPFLKGKIQRTWSRGMPPEVVPWCCVVIPPEKPGDCSVFVEMEQSQLLAVKPGGINV